MAKKKLGTLEPISDRLVIRRDAEESVSPGGIVLPDLAKEKCQLGEVVAAGPGRWLDNGQRASMQVRVGDRVFISPYAEVLKHGDEELAVIREHEVYAILHD